MDLQTLYSLGVTLMLAGILLIIIAVVLLFVSNVRGKSCVKAGGAIIIGPLPIVFGTDKKSVKTVLLLSIALMIITVIFAVILHLFFR